MARPAKVRTAEVLEEAADRRETGNDATEDATTRAGRAEL